jgi:hypothetical protein
MVDKIYQAVNRFYEGGEAAATTEPIENTDELAEETEANPAEARAEASPEGTTTEVAEGEASASAPATEEQAAEESEENQNETANGESAKREKGDAEHPEEAKS